MVVEGCLAGDYSSKLRFEHFLSLERLGIFEETTRHRHLSSMFVAT